MASIPSRACARLLGFGLATLFTFPAAAALASGGNTPSTFQESAITRLDTGIDDSGVYRNEVQACLSGRAHQARETCLEEARNALAERRRGLLDTPQEDLASNALARCDPLRGEFKAACRARVMGYGALTGSVAGGGLLREVETVVLPHGATSVRVEPQTSHPVVVITEQGQ